MRNDAHSHGMHAEKDPATGRRQAPAMSAWRGSIDRWNTLELLKNG